MRALCILLAGMACSPAAWAVVLYDSDAMTISYSVGPDSPTPELVKAAFGGTGNIMVDGVTRELSTEFSPQFVVAMPDFSTGDHWSRSVDITITAKKRLQPGFCDLWCANRTDPL